MATTAPHPPLPLQPDSTTMAMLHWASAVLIDNVKAITEMAFKMFENL